MVEHREHLQQRGTLAPEVGLGDLDTVPLGDDRCFPARRERGQVGAGDQTRQHLATGVAPRRRGEPVDGLGDEAASPLLACGLGLRTHVGAGGVGRGDEALQHPGVRRVGEQLAGHGRSAVRQPQVGGGAPVVGEELAHAGHGRRHRRQERVPVPGVADGRAEHRGQRQGAVVTEQQQPGVHRSGDRGGQGTGAGDVVHAHCRERLARGTGGSRSLPAQDAWRRVGGGRHDGRQVTARPVEVRLHDVQHEASRSRRVEGVAAELEHPLRRLRGDPVRRGHHREAAAEGRAGGEGRWSARMHRAIVPAGKRRTDPVGVWISLARCARLVAAQLWRTSRCSAPCRTLPSPSAR